MTTEIPIRHSRILVSLLGGSIVAAFVFAIPWIRLTEFTSSLQAAGRIFVEFGIPIVMLGIVIGYPLAFVMAKLRIIRRWSTTTVGAIVGAALAVLFSYGAWTGPPPGEIANPFMPTLSPLHWKEPGFTNGLPFTDADFVVSVLLGASVGAALGLTFGFLYLRATRDTRAVRS